ncbi:MAG: site-specific DNA-methyltransferase [Phycisphaerae bacterium]|nr:site-specific DNA-methyltransferase [Phycisphaerae bacterium]
MAKDINSKSPRNQTIFLDEQDLHIYKNGITEVVGPVELADIIDKTICQDSFKILDYMPRDSVDLLIADPPYNLTMKFNEASFKACDMGQYQNWLESWIRKLVRIIKSDGSLYFCGDWRSSPALFFVLQKYFNVRNRITWEREKGRGSKTNWKNSHEDIWFCTMGDKYTFNVDAVKLKRKVIAPYKDNGQPKDWAHDKDGKFRLTHPSNMWTDISVPFWSMPENTEHPTQKPEKLIAKLILASSNANDIVFDPFLGSGTTSVVARKLKRHYIGVDIDEKFCLLAEKRLAMAEPSPDIQGYSGGVFWERNSGNNIKRAAD